MNNQINNRKIAPNKRNNAQMSISPDTAQPKENFNFGMGHPNTNGFALPHPLSGRTNGAAAADENDQYQNFLNFQKLQAQQQQQQKIKPALKKSGVAAAGGVKKPNYTFLEFKKLVPLANNQLMVLHESRDDETGRTKVVSQKINVPFRKHTEAEVGSKKYYEGLLQESIQENVDALSNTMYNLTKQS